MAISRINLVDANIADLKKALDSGSITSVELISLYLHRIGYYDCRGPSFNSICVLNHNVFQEAQESDNYRASHPPRPLEGIPYTVKDSFKVKGMTVAAGSPAFADLVASEDAAIVKSLREAGAILIGKTNMPPMADGGSQRGVYGRAESPYNLTYMATAFASGSSNGCGASTSASFAAFGLAGETVSSGRAPASNNSLVGYSPSWGVLPNRGQWPLYPTCDVIVPHTRSMRDLFDVLNVAVADDVDSAKGVDFWRNQTHVHVPKPSEVRPTDYHTLEDVTSLQGKRIAVPKCFLGIEGYEPTSFCSDSVLNLWKVTCANLQALGATIIETDFPILEQYTKRDFPGQSSNVPGMSKEWVSIERCQMIATAWDDFLRENNDLKIPNLPAANPDKIRPLVAPMDDPTLHTESQNQVRYVDMIEAVRERNGTLYTFLECEDAAKALDTMRKRLYEEWMDSNGYDLVAFPTNGDVAYANADETFESMTDALRPGVLYSNGGRAFKHLGIPCITVPMGKMADKGMPVGVTFCSKAWQDQDLLRYAFAYETGSRRRVTPPLAPPLATDEISLSPSIKYTFKDVVSVLAITSTTTQKDEDKGNQIRNVEINGTIETNNPNVQVTSVTAFVNGQPSDAITVEGSTWSFKDRLTRPKRAERFPTTRTVPKDQFMVVVVAKGSNGRCAAELVVID
ncbi:hypothetical protein CEP53_011190 [Fusarium sp. AF-6]|nr:hypothetical protein CEP53_011190 [Fusarium sp. AF-6]